MGIICTSNALGPFLEHIQQLTVAHNVHNGPPWYVNASHDGFDLDTDLNGVQIHMDTTWKTNSFHTRVAIEIVSI